jgi:drug/metabolite transporter (DMT)-like permease
MALSIAPNSPLGLTLSILALLLAFTLFSLYTVLMKKAISDGTSPLLLAFLREIIATSVLLPWAYLREKRRPAQERRFWPAPEDKGAFIALGFAMIYGVQLLSALSLEHLSANTYALLAPTVPVFCLVFAIALREEPLNLRTSASWMKVGSILVTVAGAFYIAVVAYANHPSSSKGNVIVGLALLLGNKFCVGLYPVLEKRLMKRYTPSTIVAWGYANGAGLVLLATLPSAASFNLNIATSGWIAIFYSSLVSSAFNYALMAWVNSRTSPALVMSFYPWQSIATPFLAWVIMGVPLHPEDAAGGAIIVLGLALLVYARYREGKAGAGGTGKHAELKDAHAEAGIIAGQIAGATGGGSSSDGGRSGSSAAPSASEKAVEMVVVAPAGDHEAVPEALSAAAQDDQHAEWK